MAIVQCGPRNTAHDQFGNAEQAIRRLYRAGTDSTYV
jgi:hypothetical protein